MANGQSFIIRFPMLVMDQPEHIHIVSAGEHIHEAYAAAIRDLRDITHTFVFADTELYSNSARDDEQTKAYKMAARDAVTSVKAHAASLKIPAHLVYIDPQALESVVQAVIRIVKEHPSAVYSFDLSAGSKDLSLALYAVSLWLEGDAYYAFSDRKGNTALSLLPGSQGCGHEYPDQPELWQDPRPALPGLRENRNARPGCCPAAICVTSWSRFTYRSGRKV